MYKTIPLSRAGIYGKDPGPEQRPSRDGTMKTDLLLDVGGNGIKGAACPCGGVPGPIREFPAHSDAPRSTLIAHFSGILRTLAGEQAVGRIAMAFPGPFDYARGIPRMRGLAKYESLYGVALPEALEADGVSAGGWAFINDVSAYALGACAALSPSHRALAVCLGTGAGSAFLLNGTLCTAPAEGIPENGWIYALPFRESILDDYLSDRGIRALSRRMLGKECSPLELNQAQPLYDPVWHAFGQDLLDGLKPVLCAFRPTDLVMGGKISLAWERFGAPLGTYCASMGIRVRVAPNTSEHVIHGLLRFLASV